MTKNDFILMLVRSALWQSPLDSFKMTPWEYKEVMDVAEKQCVTGLVTDCLKSNGVNLQKKCVVHMLQLQNTLTMNNRALDKGIVELSQLFNKHKIRYAVVKGQTIAAFYPKPSLRIPGDIDFWVAPHDITKAIDVLNKAWGTTLKKEQFGLKHIGFDYNGLKYEFHKNLLALTTRKNIKYLDKLIDSTPNHQITIGQYKQVMVPEPTVNVLYTFCHLFHHLRIEGVAWRQLCDWAVMMKHYQSEINNTKLLEYLRTMGYTKAYAAFGSIIIKKLGYPESDFPMSITSEDEKWGNKIHEDILKHGNWGIYDSGIGDKHILSNKIKFWFAGICRYVKYFGLAPKETLSFTLCSIPTMMIGWLRGTRS